VRARAGEEGKLFGSVTAADIAEALSAQTSVPIDRRDVHLDEPIRSIGTHQVTVHLHPEVDPVVTIDVRAQE
jgi:large subunit ribosomal protein L9